jgi:hypothetical protein
MDDPSQNSQNPYASPPIQAETVNPSSSASRNKPNEPLVEPIRTSGALSLTDYYYGVRLGRRRLRRFALLIFFVAPLLYLFWALNPNFAFDKLGMVILIYLSAISFGGCGIIIIQWLRNGQIRKIHAAGKGVFAHTESVMYEDYYETRQEVMVAKVMWSMFCKFRYSDRLVVMYYDGNPFVFGIIPRSKFQNRHDWECFIGLLDRKMPRC